MTMKRRAAACLLSALLCGGTQLGAQSVSLAISAIAADSTSPAPVMTVTGQENRPELGPYSVSLELSLESQFNRPFYINVAGGESAIFTVDSLLPERTMVFFRARLTDNFGTVVAQTIVQHPVRSWVRLIAPAAGNPANLTTRSPKFVWSSPAITVPPGLWVYDLTVINKATGQPDFFKDGLNDTSFVFPKLLESNTSYRWRVHARAQSSRAARDQISVTSEGSFVIASTDQPTFTPLYQNFPNPFGRGERSAVTCFWIDLARDATLRLTIYDIRLREVRNVIPSPNITGKLPRGAYGRQIGGQTDCAKGLEWDGRDDAGRFVPPGVYVAVLQGDGPRQSIKIVFRGP
jgi:hypothetical protein